MVWIYFLEPWKVLLRVFFSSLIFVCTLLSLYQYLAWGQPSVYHQGLSVWGLPGGSGVKNLPVIRRHWRCQFDPSMGKIPWMRACQPTPAFLPGESHGQRSLGATVHGVVRSQTWLTIYTYIYVCVIYTHNGLLLSY